MDTARLAEDGQAVVRLAGKVTESSLTNDPQKHEEGHTFRSEEGDQGLKC